MNKNPFFEYSATLSPADEHRHLTFPFEVPDGINRLELYLSYTPMLLEDKQIALPLIKEALKKYGYEHENPMDYIPISNLITLSIDDPVSYRGNAHRKENPLNAFITKEDASPGFIAGSIIKGKWRLCLHTHGLVTPSLELFCKVVGL